MKIICVGRNYADHAKELKNDLPTEPVLFLKPQNAVLAPDKPFLYPEFTKDLHYECELVVRMCKNGKYIQEKFANRYYDEMTLGIDFTARDLQREQQKKGLPWEIAKAFDNSAAVGQFQPINEHTDVQNLSFLLKKNGETVQTGHTADMIFNVNRIVEYASQFFTLNIGDLIFTGTPAGVGPVLVGDRLELVLDGITVHTVDIK